MRLTSFRPLALVLAFALVGCGTIDEPAIHAKAPGTSNLVVPDSPQATLGALTQAMNDRDALHYGQLFTADYAFQFAISDSAGNPFRNRALTREQEVASAIHLLVTGTASLPPATRVVLTFDRNFLPEPDSRPGKVFPWHEEVKMNFVLSIDTGDAAYRLTGAERFFFVRGDSAQIPPDLALQGFRPDASRWWIERWEDESAPSLQVPNDGPTPTKFTSWGDLKVLYL